MPKNLTQILSFTLLVSLVFPCSRGNAESVSLSTYYPSPMGAYDRLRLVPRPALSDGCGVGSLYVNSSNNYKLFFCKDRGTGVDDGIWGSFGTGFWAQAGNNLFPKDATTIADLRVGMGRDVDETHPLLARLHATVDTFLIKDVVNNPYVYLLDSDSKDWKIEGIPGGSDLLNITPCDSPLSCSNAIMTMQGTSTGNLGINTSSPAYKLHVVGQTISIDDANAELRFEDTDPAASEYDWSVGPKVNSLKFTTPGSDNVYKEPFSVGYQGNHIIKGKHPSLSFNDTDGDDWLMSPEGQNGTFLKMVNINSGATPIQIGGTGVVLIEGITPTLTLYNTSEGYHDDDWRIDNEGEDGTYLQFYRINDNDPVGNGSVQIGDTGKIQLVGTASSWDCPKFKLIANNGNSKGNDWEWSWSVIDNGSDLHLVNVFNNVETSYFVFGQHGMKVVHDSGDTTLDPNVPFSVHCLTWDSNADTDTTNYKRLAWDTTDFRIGYSSSSIKYKKDVKPLHDDVYKILSLRPVSFVYKSTNQPDIGVIAEEAEKLGLQNLVIYDKDGHADGFGYDKVPLYYLQIVKDQQQKIQMFKERHQKLEDEVNNLEQRLSELEKTRE